MPVKTLTVFKCEALKCTLTLTSCATRWLRANHGKFVFQRKLAPGQIRPSKDAFVSCKDCRIGAYHYSRGNV
jgi:hypothetical protein